MLVPVDVEREGPLVDLDDVGLRERLDRTHYGLLREHGMSHFDISAIRSRNRQVTQVVSRDLFERDAAGLIFRSNIDDCRCLVAFEGRAELMPEGEEVSLSEDLPELRQVATEFGLLLE